MNSDLQRKLVLEFPRFFQYLNNTDVVISRVVITERGIECGDGWYEILRELAGVGEQIDGLRCTQVKQKCGLLRVYVFPMGSAIFGAAMRHAEELSAVTCEVCGNSGVIRHIQADGAAYSRYAVRCNEHAQQLPAEGV